MAYTTEVFTGSPYRTADEADELSALVARAVTNGWLELASGTATPTGRFATWLVKPAGDDTPLRVSPCSSPSLGLDLRRTADRLAL